jgi:hypothetical protein
MRTTITLDDDLFKKAAVIANDDNASSLVTKALEMLIAAESKKRLLRLSGKTPDFTIPGRESRSADLGCVAENETHYNS